jgi:mono/diheme cytochrome c family protein
MLTMWDYNRPKAEEVPAMTKRLTLGAVLLLLSFFIAKQVSGHGDQRSGLQAKSVTADEDRERVLAAGKKLFVERCAKCHDERGDKPLKSGLPLNRRELSDEELARAVSGRLKNSPDEDKRAVTLYISSFMQSK